MTALSSDFPKTVYLCPADGDIHGEHFRDTTTMLEGLGYIVRAGVSLTCPTCGFLAMRDRETGNRVNDLCICEMRKLHVPWCTRLLAVSAKIDTGCSCENNSVDCPDCYRCSCP